MIFRLTPEDVQRGASVRDAPWITPNNRAGSSGVVLRGDDTGLALRYLHRDPGCLRVSPHLPALLDDLTAAGIRLHVSARAVSHLLHHGLVPLPWTIYEGIHVLGIGDRAQVGVAEGRITLDLTNEYPYFLDRGAGDRKPDAARLLELLTAAATRQLAAGGSGFLMLSSGKDSSAIALALAEAGLTGFPCVTYKSDARDDEHLRARALCRRLGLQHETVEIEPSDGRVEGVLREFFAASPLPCADIAQVPYALCVARAGSGSAAVVDGLGNDSYMGYLPGARDRLKYHLALGDGRLTRMLSAWVPPHAAWSYLLRSPAAAVLPGRTLRYRETRRFYGDSVETDGWWQELSREWRHLGTVGFRNSPVERHVDQAANALKVRLAAGFRGMNVALPFCDPDLIDYYSNLPEGARFDRRRSINKVLLREMLSRFASYDADVIGKHWFQFDAAAFLLRHRSFVVDEIRRCALWDGRVGPLLEAAMNGMPRRPAIAHSLLPLLMVSGWYNHARFLRPSRRDGYPRDAAAAGASIEHRGHGGPDRPRP